MNNDTPAVPDSLQAFTDCPEWGKGGSFIYDPITGQRTRVVPPAEPDAPPAVAPVAEPVVAEAQALAIEFTPVKKEKARA